MNSGMRRHKRWALKLYLSIALAGLSPHAAAEEPRAPCSTPTHDEFDFWIGEWEVSAPDGKQAGTNHIEKILGDCVIFENWQSANSGYSGKSFNTYDVLTQTWNQVWVDTAGSTIHFSGMRKDNVMEMTGTHVTQNGTVVHYRMSYTSNADGTVRQLWQQSLDRQTWETLFDGLYKRK